MNSSTAPGLRGDQAGEMESCGRNSFNTPIDGGYLSDAQRHDAEGEYLELAGRFFVGGPHVSLRRLSRCRNLGQADQESRDGFRLILFGTEQWRRHGAFAVNHNADKPGLGQGNNRGVTRVTFGEKLGDRLIRAIRSLIHGGCSR